MRPVHSEDDDVVHTITPHARNIQEAAIQFSRVTSPQTAAARTNSGFFSAACQGIWNVPIAVTLLEELPR